jgi:hypothetical protein
LRLIQWCHPKFTWSIIATNSDKITEGCVKMINALELIWNRWMLTQYEFRMKIRWSICDKHRSIQLRELYMKFSWENSKSGTLHEIRCGIFFDEVFGRKRDFFRILLILLPNKSLIERKAVEEECKYQWRNSMLWFNWF